MTNIYIFLIIIAFSPEVLADDCLDYPFTDGMNIEELDDGLKIISTSSASVSFDDIDSVKDARDEATLLAKAEISKFLTEKISSDEAIKKAVNESKSTTNAGKSVNRTEVIEKIKTLRNISSSLLKGVQNIGDCYTPGSEIRVSVGIKPSTIKQAQRIQGQIGSNSENDSLAGDDDKNADNRVSPKSVGGFSNTERLNGF